MQQKNDKNRFWGNSVFIFLSRFFNNIAGLLVMFFYAHQLTQVDYGHYQAFWTQLNVFNAFAGIGLMMLSVTYSSEKIRALFRAIKRKYYFAYFIFLGIFSFFFGLLQTQNSLSTPWALLFLVAFAICNISDALLIAFRRFRPLVWINLGYAIVYFIIHYVFLGPTSFDFNGLLACLLPLLLLKLIISAGVIFRTKYSGKMVEEAQAKVSKAMYSLWRHLYFYDILQIASLWLDKFLISLLLGSRETAIYINGTLNIPFLPIFFAAVTGSALIHLSQKHKRIGHLEMVNQVGKILSSIAFPLCIFLIFFRTEFITFAFSDKYLASIPIFLAAIFIIPFRAYGHTIILQNMEKGKIINQGAILDIVVALLAMYPLYLLWGLPGVALSFVLSTGVQAIFYYYHTRKLFGASFRTLYPLKNWLIKALSFILLTWGIYTFLPIEWGNTLRLLIGGVIVFSFALLTLFWEWRRSERLMEDKSR